MSIKLRVLVSACLVGWRTRYDGGAKLSARLMERARKERWSLVPVCPELLGGLPVPRAPAAIEGGNGYAVLDGKSRVLDENGRDVTEAFLRGARQVLDIARKTGCTMAILADNSPSCGVRFRDDPKGMGKRIGVTAALLQREISEKFVESDFHSI